jgi:hypothetical protein
MAKRLKLYHYFERIDRIAGIGRYGVLLIGVKGAAPLDQPMPKLTGPDDVLFVAPYSEGNAKILQLDVDPTSSRYGLPLIYEIALTRDINSTMIGPSITKNVKVHYTRVIHVADGLIEDDMYGIPRMQRVWNYLDDLDKVVGGGSEAVWRTVDRGIQFDVDKEMELSEDDEEDFSQAIEDYMHGLKRYIKTRGIKANVLGSDVPDPTGAIQAVMSLIAGTSGIPQRMLLGSEAGQLASGQDERNFNARVKERQTSYAEDVILSSFADRMMVYGALPKSKYKVKWPDVSTLTEKERADVAARFAQAITNVAKQTQGGETVMTGAEFKAKFIDD